MTRSYVLKNPPPLAVRQERARKAAAARNSLDNQVRKVAERADELTPEHIEILRGALARQAGGKTE